MASVDDARTVHVLVEDLSVVLADDVHDWLKIIDDIDEMKVQYDTAQQRPFYWVRFKHTFAAQQAVNYLDGERLKNQVVRIHSSVYTKQPLDKGDTASHARNEHANEGEEGMEARANSVLPLNHRMPRDMQMDDVLVNTIPALLSESGENSENSMLVQKLQRLQESYCHVQEEIHAAKNEMLIIDEEVVKLLQGNSITFNNPTKISGCTINVRSDEKHGEIGRCRRVRSAPNIPTSLFDPASLVSKLTRYVGPVTDYSFTVSSDGHSLQATVEFFHTDDAALALCLLKGHGGATCSMKKRPRWELNSEDALSSLAEFEWFEETSVAPLQPPDLSVTLFEAHKKAASMLHSFVE